LVEETSDTKAQYLAVKVWRFLRTSVESEYVDKTPDSSRPTGTPVMYTEQDNHRGIAPYFGIKTVTIPGITVWQCPFISN
jgi:hypothetical protein